VKTTQEYEKGMLLLGDSPWRDNLLTMASKHCSLPHSRSPWRANIAPCHVIARRGEQITRRGEL